MARLVCLAAAALAAGGCASMPFADHFGDMGGDAPDERSRVAEEFGRLVAFGVAIERGDTLESACRAARAAAVADGLAAIAEAGLVPVHPFRLKDRVNVSEHRCFVQVKWTRLAEAQARRATPRGVLVAAQAPMAAEAGLPPVPMAHPAAAPVFRTDAPAPTTLVYLDLRSGESAPAPRLLEVAAARREAAAVRSELADPRLRERGMGIGVGVCPSTWDVGLGIEVPFSFPLWSSGAFLLDLTAAPGFYPDWSELALGARGELALGVRPLRFLRAVDLQLQAGLGLRALWAPVPSDSFLARDFLGHEDLSLGFEPALAFVVGIPSINLEVRQSVGLPLIVVGQANDLVVTSSLTYRF